MQINKPYLMLKKILFFIFCLSPSIAVGMELPFTDVPTDSLYYTDLKQMYNAGVVPDTVDNLFHPNRLLHRDEFV
jgi:hypothetical protein